LLLFVRTTLLMGLLTSLLILVAGAISMATGYDMGASILMALIFAGAMNLFAYYYSDKIVLRMYGAKEVSEREYPRLHQTVSMLSAVASIPKPKVAVMEEATPNAFATGRNPSNSVVVVTKGLLRLLREDEIEGVLGHEIAHIKHRDILIGTIAAVIASAIAYLALMGRFLLLFGGGNRERGSAMSLIGLFLIAFFVPIAALMVRFAISRSEEYRADEEGARITGKPEALASALRKIESYVRGRPMSKGNPATSHMFIVNPFRGESWSMFGLFSTHPPTHKRIERLMKIAREMGRVP